MSQWKLLDRTIKSRSRAHEADQTARWIRALATDYTDKH
jgi:hypothetical protein